MSLFPCPFYTNSPDLAEHYTLILWQIGFDCSSSPICLSMLLFAEVIFPILHTHPVGSFQLELYVYFLLRHFAVLYCLLGKYPSPIATVPRRVRYFFPFLCNLFSASDFFFPFRTTMLTEAIFEYFDVL